MEAFDLLAFTLSYLWYEEDRRDWFLVMRCVLTCFQTSKLLKAHLCEHAPGIVNDLVVIRKNYSRLSIVTQHMHEMWPSTLPLSGSFIVFSGNACQLRFDAHDRTHFESPVLIRRRPTLGHTPTYTYTFPLNRLNVQKIGILWFDHMVPCYHGNASLKHFLLSHALYTIFWCRENRVCVESNDIDSELWKCVGQPFPVSFV